ncbi:Hint domain-containing protein [Methylobacterium sp. NEAU 140]|uniref:Hint domain-containing protein n=1 Tax=Methylobacterium sp. NEAU 140 TaxID=3064945 RepID=UPI002732B62A|nr:Hint domain-containing protein [Methylobacterium sp. NEAU 140]MDP4025237.1 Hint domain-containing protein [Methylobacterium sp. NEAU 140]
MNPITFNTVGSFTYTVPVTGTYDLSAFGAGGGSTDNGAGGSGAQIGATFNLTAGQQLFIIVGGVGGSAGDGVRNGAGGGGFSEIYTRDASNNITPLLIAGGGGGAAATRTGENASVANPGTLGGGGLGGASVAGNGDAGAGGGGGAGATANGFNGSNAAGGGTSGQGGADAANGAAGGAVQTPGGFGGGGGGGGVVGAGFGGGGGGGGATGGRGGSADVSAAGPFLEGGRGGTSYISNTGVQNFAETMSGNTVSRGNGSVRILAPGNNVPCYCTGTRILTDRGAVAVEDLAIGDTVVTASGARRPIRWIGTRSYGGRFANANPAVLPVTVRAGALADGVPARDLAVSPDHALFLDGLLVPAELLVNGASITRAERIESVTYWHVELDSHDVLLAEGAPAESYVDDGGRAIFHNAASSRAPCPGAAPAAAAYCAPRVADDGAHGYALEAIRRRLAIRAGLPVARARVFGALRGAVEACDGRRVTGWAQDAAHPDGPVCLDVVVDGATVALVYADGYRADLEAAGIGDGCHGFALDLPEALDGRAPHTVELRRSADATSLGILHLPALARSDRAA